ncbi:MAG: hypothetical protein ABGW99_15120 [Zunongwangia sp.]|uniref:hypothetical protein n=1 Tax=Zunongwangia sp. TaxID=1965325 RepID=UPI00324297DA
MNLIKFKDFQLIFTPSYIQMEIFHEGHFGVKDYEECLQMKLEAYGEKKSESLLKE